jgi:uncharacterized protein YjdB
MKLPKLGSLKLMGGALLVALSSLSFGISLSTKNQHLYEAYAYYSPSTTYTNGDGASYYDNINSSATGTTLLSSLRTLNSTKRQKTIGYSTMGTSASTSPYVYTDYNPSGQTYTDSNGQVYGTQLVSFYTKTPMTSYNKEHVWPDSRGGGYVDNDIHMPRPTISAENSSRGNSFYVEGLATSNNTGWDPYTAGYSEISRGESARIVFYSVVASSSLGLSDQTNILSGAPGYTTTMGKLSDMLKWNLQYNITQYETNRNEGAQYLQGNRNPFIDRPEYACQIWGDTNDATRQVCGANQAPNTITVTPASSSIAVGGTVTLTASVDSGSSSVTWATSNANVATVNNGVVSGLATGTVTITATSMLDGSVKGTASVTVKSLTSLSVSGTPITTTYAAGQMFNPEGLTVTATYSDTSVSNVTSSVGWTPSPLTQGTTSVTGSYGGLTVVVSGLTVTEPSGYSLVTNTSQLTAGDSIIFAYKPNSVTAGSYVSSYLTSVSDATFSIDKNTITNAGSSLLFTLGGASGSWTFANSEGKFLSSSSKNLSFADNASSNNAKWTISIASENATVANVATPTEELEYNTSAPRFKTYDSGLAPIQIYSQAAAPSSVAVTGVSLDTSTLNLIVGTTSNLTAAIAPTNATNQNVTWSSSNSNIASVSGGVITANEAGNATITVTSVDGGFTATCEVTVSVDTVTSVEVMNNMTYHPGEAIDKDDLMVTLTYASGATNTTTDFSFSDDGYQFTYEDTNSGASSKTKQFAITYDGDSYNFSVNVARVTYVAPSGASSMLSSSDFSASTVSKSSGTPSNSSVTIGGIPFTVTTNAYIFTESTVNYLSFGKNTGSINNTNAFTSDLTSVTVTQKSGARADGVLTISKDTNTWVAYSVNELATGGYRYLSYGYTGTVSGSGAATYSNIQSISFTLSGQDNPVNVANYIMYEDTDNQCLTKLDLAVEKLNTMSGADKNTFWTSNEYIIATARERLQAWALHEGQVLNLHNGSFEMSRSINVPLWVDTNTSTSAGIFAISIMLLVVTVGSYLYFIRKKQY